MIYIFSSEFLENVEEVFFNSLNIGIDKTVYWSQYSMKLKNSNLQFLTV